MITLCVGIEKILVPEHVLDRINLYIQFHLGKNRSILLYREHQWLGRGLVSVDQDHAAIVIQDRVTLVDMHRVRFDIEPSETHAGGALTIAIEEPEPGFLFLRFTYETTLASNPNSEERAYIEYVKSAYHQSDVDCVRIIRTLAAGGQIQ